MERKWAQKISVAAECEGKIHQTDIVKVEAVNNYSVRCIKFVRGSTSVTDDIYNNAEDKQIKIILAKLTRLNGVVQHIYEKANQNPSSKISMLGEWKKQLGAVENCEKNLN